jgi:hypothetical protein
MNAGSRKDWAGETPKPNASSFELPPIVQLNDFLAESIPMPEVLVDGLIRKRSVVMLASGSKSFKTWIVLHLALCVSEGVPWLDRKVKQGRVLFLNSELTPADLQSRLAAIADSMGSLSHSGFDICNLRGQNTDIVKLMPALINQCEGKDYAMIIPDPIYSMMGDRNEIAANEMAEFLHHFTRLSEATGAAVIYTHHFAKGNSAKKEQIDRASGSGVFSRHADGIITFTRHKEDNAFSVEAELRSFRRPTPFLVMWEYPIMEIVDLDPTQLRNKAGRQRMHTVPELLECLKDGMTAGEWIAAAEKVFGIKKSTFYPLRKEAMAADRVYEDDRKWFRKPQPKIIDFKQPEDPTNGTNSPDAA